MDEVTADVKVITIPTYPVGEPDKNPLFLEKRVYQGSSGAVYPYPVIESVADTPVEQEYTAVFLENRYLKLMILPQLGGRLQMALDKTNGYHFIYYNRVIKPALVGLAGPWISGGIEFNWPQHHRPTTFMPVDWRIEENSDGSKTVWCAEIEPMFNTKGMHGFTLYPDRAYVEIPVQLYNRTSEPQTFLWWANPAVHVNDDYQSIFPPDVHAVMDHGKRDVSEFPIAKGTYYKVDYASGTDAPGTDISRYKNIPVPTSYMAYHSDFDFVGCYDHGVQAGMMHVANHHVVPGKKQWTWGKGDFGTAWDRQLTDEDGPYIELMCGAYTDNQPDFSWLMPGEEKCFTQIFMPYKEIGGAKNATKEAVLNLEMEGNTAVLSLYLTQPRTVQIELFYGDEVLLAETADLSPTQTFYQRVPLPDGFVAQQVTVRVMANGRDLISFTPLPDEQHPIPEPAKPAPPPAEVSSNEELFLHGLHLEQYRHATYAPEPYYEEALRRDPLDSRCNNALGLLLYRRGKFAEAEAYFRTAVTRLTRRNPNPYDGEPTYNLGLSLKMQGHYQEAFDAFYKATWNAAWQDAAYFELARLACRARRFEEALDLVTRCLHRNWRHHKARHLQTAVLRHLHREDQAIAATELALSLDRMAYGALWERHLLLGERPLAQITQGYTPMHTEIALDYAHAGLWKEAIDLLQLSPNDGPMVRYYLAWCLVMLGREEAAKEVLETAVAPDYCFPNRLESVLALQTAMALNPQDAHAPYFLGNFW
jgi:tetratricopeptide (TPR) repeat protein